MDRAPVGDVSPGFALFPSVPGRIAGLTLVPLSLRDKTAPLKKIRVKLSPSGLGSVK